ncbi:MAG TPA: hypothetical protein VEB00_08355 [Clostridia bacterium]|nr:hypothetical protein [Clostridia bacterium]
MGYYNLKNITLGIGIGLIFSSMVNINLSSRELTVEEIKREAAKHSLTVLTNEEIYQTPASPTITPSPTGTPTPTPTPAPAKITPTPTPAKQAASGKITINVKGGMSSEGIADLLKESGLIKDTKAFLKRLEEVKKDDKLKIGNFEIPKNSGYDDIIKILTK